MRVTVERCKRVGGIWGLCAVAIRLALPNRAPAVELVIGQLQYGQPSVTSMPCVGRMAKCGRPTSTACLASPSTLSARMPVTIHKVPLNFMITVVACLILKRTQANSVSTQEINPITCLLDRWPGDHVTFITLAMLCLLLIYCSKRRKETERKDQETCIKSRRRRYCRRFGNGTN